MNMSQLNSRSRLPSVVKLCGNAIPVRHGAGAFYREPIDLCLIGGTHCVSNEGFKYYYSQKDDKLFCEHGKFFGQYDVLNRAFLQMNARDVDSVRIDEECALTIKRRLFVSGMVGESFAREPQHDFGMKTVPWQYYAYFALIDEFAWDTSQCVLVRKAKREQSFNRESPHDFVYELYNASFGFVPCACNLIMCVEHQRHLRKCSYVKFSHVQDVEMPNCFRRATDYQCRIVDGVFTHKISCVGAKWEVFGGFGSKYLPEYGVWDDDPALKSTVTHLSVEKAYRVATALSIGKDEKAIKRLINEGFNGDLMERKRC